MPTIIDITPVSSQTSHTEPPHEPESRWAHAKAVLRRRLIVMGFVLAALAVIALVVSIGLFIFIAASVTGAALVAVVVVRGWWQRLRSGSAVGPRRDV